MKLSELISKAQTLSNSGKSINVKNAVSVINSSEKYTAIYEERIGYKDTKVAGQRFVTSRKVVTYYKISILVNGKIIYSIDSELTSHTSYSFTNFIAYDLK